MELTLHPGEATLSVGLTAEKLQLAVESRWGAGFLTVPVDYWGLLFRACGAGALLWGSRAVLRRAEWSFPVRSLFKGKHIRL